MRQGILETIHFKKMSKTYEANFISVRNILNNFYLTKNFWSSLHVTNFVCSCGESKYLQTNEDCTIGISVVNKVHLSEVQHKKSKRRKSF